MCKRPSYGLPTRRVPVWLATFPALALASCASASLPRIDVTARGDTTSESGGSVILAVELAEQPSANLEVYAEPSRPAEAAVSEPLLFSPHGTLGGQLVVRGLDDGVDDGDQPYEVRIFARRSSPDGREPVLIDTVSLVNLARTTAPGDAGTGADNAEADDADAGDAGSADGGAPDAGPSSDASDADASDGDAGPALPLIHIEPSGYVTSEDWGSVQVRFSIDAPAPYALSIYVQADPITEIYSADPVNIFAPSTRGTLLLQGRPDGIDDGDRSYEVTIYARYIDGPPMLPVVIGSLTMTNLDIDG